MKPVFLVLACLGVAFACFAYACLQYIGNPTSDTGMEKVGWTGLMVCVCAVNFVLVRAASR